MRASLLNVCNGWRGLAVAMAMGCASLANADVEELDNTELSTLDPKAVLIDVRRPDEWSKSGVVEGSIPITFFDKKGRYDVSAWLAAAEAHGVTKDTPIVLICEAGVRSSRIADLLDKRLGYSSVGNVTEGIRDWIDEGRPVSTWDPEAASVIAKTENQ